jgi:hypothetical protein
MPSIAGLAFEGVAGDHLAEPSVLSGQRDGGVVHGIYDVLLSDIHQTVAGGVRKTPATPAEYTGIYPESNIWTESTTPPASGLYLRYVNGLVTRDTAVVTRKDDVRPPTALEDVTAVTTS